MLDKDKNIISKKILLKKFYLAIKRNVAIMAIVIPIVIAMFGYIIDIYFYYCNCGYYKYFGIDRNLMLPYNRTVKYQYLLQLAWCGLYWIYAIFAVRILGAKRKYIWKIVLLIVSPTVINTIMVYHSYGNISLSLVIAGAILGPIHWPLIFYLGYCVLPSTCQKVVDKIVEKRKKMKKERLGNREYDLLGGFIILAVAITIFTVGNNLNYRKAAEQRRFGIVDINNEKYALIEANENKLILQRCEIDQTTLKIDKNTYLCIENQVPINFQMFDEVKIE